MRINVTTLPVNEIIEDISKSLNISLNDGKGELTINIPEELGEGYIRGASFDSGIGIITYNCKFNKDVEIHFTQNSVHPLKFIFCSEGSVAHKFEADEQVHNIEAYQNIIVSSSGYNGHVLYFKANVQTHVSSLEIIRSTFSHRDNYNFQDLDETLKELFKDEVAKKAFFYHGNYSLRAADLMEELDNNDYTGFLRSLYLEGKSFLMLAVQIAQYQDDEVADRLPNILRKSDIEKVKYVVNRVDGDVGANFTVDSLAKEAGTNINKLQDGFKHVFNLTVNKYIQNKKLEIAKEMLMTTEKNISEIVAAIGLNNRSYFSKVFKEKYGVNPKYFLKSRRADAE